MSEETTSPDEIIMLTNFPNVYIVFTAVGAAKATQQWEDNYYFKLDKANPNTHAVKEFDKFRFNNSPVVLEFDMSPTKQVIVEIWGTLVGWLNGSSIAKQLPETLATALEELWRKHYLPHS